MPISKQKLTYEVGIFAIGLYIIQFGKIYNSIYISHLALLWVFFGNIKIIVEEVYKRTYGKFFLIIFFAMLPGIFRTPFLEDPLASLTIIAQSLFLLLIVTPSFIFIAKLNINRSADNILFFAAIASTIAISLFVFELAGYNLAGSSYLTISLGKEGVDGFAGRYSIGNPNLHAIMLSLAVVFAYSSPQKLLSTKLIHVSLIMASLFLTFSRGAYFVVPITIIFGGFATAIARKNIKPIVSAVKYVGLIGVLGFGLFVYGDFFDDIDRYLSLARIFDATKTFENESGVGGRVYLLNAGLEGVARYPLFGIGFGQALTYIVDEIPHVFIVLWALENGILSSFLLAIAWLIFLHVSFNTSLRTKNYYILFGVIGFSLWTFTSTYAYYPGFALIYGLPFIFSAMTNNDSNNKF